MWGKVWLESDRTWQESQFYNLTAMDSGQESQFPCLGFLICKMGLIELSQNRITVGFNRSSLCKVPSTNITLTG